MLRSAARSWRHCAHDWRALARRDASTARQRARRRGLDELKQCADAASVARALGAIGPLTTAPQLTTALAAWARARAYAEALAVVDDARARGIGLGTVGYSIAISAAVKSGANAPDLPDLQGYWRAQPPSLRGGMLGGAAAPPPSASSPTYPTPTLQ